MTQDQLLIENAKLKAALAAAQPLAAEMNGLRALNAEQAAYIKQLEGKLKSYITKTNLIGRQTANNRGPVLRSWEEAAKIAATRGITVQQALRIQL